MMTRRKNKPAAALAYVIASCLLTWHCKPQTGASLQSLDDAASGRAEINPANLCGAAEFNAAKIPPYVQLLDSSAAIVSTNQNPAARQAVLSTLAAAPKGLLQMFFLIGNGQIVIGGANSACATTPITAAERALMGKNSKVRSCWIAPTAQATLRVVIDDDPKFIRFSLLRLLSYVEAEYFMPRILNPGISAPFNGPQWQGYAKGFVASRERLANAFLTDMKALGSTKVVEMGQYYAQEPVSFGNMVYANAVDSYFCSAATNQTFQTTFSNTWRVYTDPQDSHAPLQHLGPATF